MQLFLLLIFSQFIIPFVKFCNCRFNIMRIPRLFSKPRNDRLRINKIATNLRFSQWRVLIGYSDCHIKIATSCKQLSQWQLWVKYCSTSSRDCHKFYELSQWRVLIGYSGCHIKIATSCKQLSQWQLPFLSLQGARRRSNP